MSQQVAFPWLAPIGRSARERAKAAAAPRVAPSAVRIPDPRLTELPLSFTPIGPQIFVHEGARQALERRLQSAMRTPVWVAVTDNRRRMVTHTRAHGGLRVRIHMMFLDAPEHVQEALVRYISDDDRHASQTVGEFIEANSHRIRAAQAVPGPLHLRGRVHDLYAYLQSVNHRYFGGVISNVLVTWGRRTQPRGTKRTTIKLGSYSTVERLIRVHPCLDAEWVPRYFVSYIVYHELLHHVIPPRKVGGRHILHPKEFLRREREYRQYERAIAWEKKHISRLLRAK